MSNSYFYPEEIEQRNIIDRLANFVAKNGNDFELMTKQKQQGNPMFEFLFGGAHSDYYQHRLTEERMMVESENRMQRSISEYLENNSTTSFTTSSNQYGFDFTQTSYFRNFEAVNSLNKRLEDLKMSLAKMQEDHYQKLSDSQQNLATESVKISKEKFSKCMKTVGHYRLMKIRDCCRENDLNFEQLENIIQSLIMSCTKENICNGKNFVIEHMIKGIRSTQCICDYLLLRVSMSTIFNEKLHIIYFLNDLLHYCKRKAAGNLLQAIESVIVLIYSMCVSIADDDGKSKLNKVLSLWESNGYIKNDILHSMRIYSENSVMYLETWQENEINIMKREEDEGIFRDANIPIDETIDGIFSDAKMKLSNLEANHNQLKYELKLEEENLEIEIYQLEREIKLSESELRKAPRDFNNDDYQEYQENEYSQSVLNNYEMSFQMPDLTRPPPGFGLCEMPCPNPEPQFIPNIHPQPEFEIKQRPERPPIPYWRLPAAVMVAHIKLTQYDYVPIDANAIQLPQLRPPTKRLMDITNTFYQPPSHDRPRDTEGWEKLALHEFYKAKEKAKNGEIPDDFVNILHEKQIEEDYHDSIPNNDRLMDTDYRNMELNDINEFRQSFSDHNSSNPDYNFHHSAQYGNSSSCPPRINPRSLLGSPWEDYRHPPFNNTPEMAPVRHINYNSNNRMPPSLLGGPPRHMPPKVTPLMSLDISNNFKRHQNQRPKRNSYSRNSEENYNRNRGRPRYSSRSRSPYDRSLSRSRSRSRSSRYSRSRSRSYSRSRSASRSRSLSSQSSRSSDKRPYKGGFIARRSRSKSYSRSKSLSPSPISKSDFEKNNQLNKKRLDIMGETSESFVRNDRFVGVGAHVKDDDFSRFRQRKSFGYSEWMKERTEKRSTAQEDNSETY